MPGMKTKMTPTAERLKAIFILFSPGGSDSYASWEPQFRGMSVGLTQTPAGQKRNKKRDAYNVEQEWRTNLAFVTGLSTLIPPGSSVLRAEADKLLLKMFGNGFSADRQARSNTAEARRTRKNGDAAWRLVKKLRKHYGILIKSERDRL